MQRHVSTERLLILNHVTRSAEFQTGVMPCVMLMLLGVGCVALAVGAFWLVNKSQGAIPPQVKSLGIPVFIIIGLLFIGGAIRAIVRSLAARARGEKYANEPWLADGRWDQRGARDEEGTSGKVLLAILLGMFLTPCNWLVFFPNTILKKELSALFIAAVSIVSFFDLLMALVVGMALMSIARRFKYGSSRIDFAKFPYFLGENMTVMFSSTRPIAQFDNIRFTLRCVEEKVIKTQRDGTTEIKVEVYSIYADTLLIDEPGVSFSGNKPLPLSFDLPGTPDAGTNFSSKPPRYWELEIHADTPGVDYHARFLVPIYAKLPNTN